MYKIKCTYFKYTVWWISEVYVYISITPEDFLTAQSSPCPPGNHWSLFHHCRWDVFFLKVSSRWSHTICALLFFCSAEYFWDPCGLCIGSVLFWQVYFCMGMPICFTCLWTFGLFPVFGSYKWNFFEHFCSCLGENTYFHFSWVNTEWICWIIF